MLHFNYPHICYYYILKYCLTFVLFLLFFTFVIHSGMAWKYIIFYIGISIYWYSHVSTCHLFLWYYQTGLKNTWASIIGNHFLKSRLFGQLSFFNRIKHSSRNFADLSDLIDICQAPSVQSTLVSLIFEGIIFFQDTLIRGTMILSVQYVIRCWNEINCTSRLMDQHISEINEF